MAIEGTLETFQLPEILQMIAAQRKTGILTVQGESDIVAVSFKDGQVVAADALNQTVEEGLGQILASQGLVSPRDFAAVTAEHESGGKRLLDLLLERGHVHRGQLLEALRLQTYRLLLQLLMWERGEFKFYAGDEVAFEEGFYAISVEELLIRSLSDLGEDGHGATVPDLESYYELLPGGPAIRFVAGEGTPPADGSAVWLAPEDRPLVERLDGVTSARSLAADTGLGEYRVLFTLYRLLRAGAVRLVRRDATLHGQRFPPAAPGRPGLAPPAPSARPVPPGSAGRPAASAPSGAGAGAVASSPADVELLHGLEPELPAAEPARRRGRVVTLQMPAKRISGVAAVLPPLVALGMLAVLLAAPAFAPRGLLLPFPWQDANRQALEGSQRSARYLQLDRAARTFFLLEGHYPDRPDELVSLGLIGEGALRDPSGNPFQYSSDALSYQLQPLRDGRPDEERGVREAVTGDFLLDPDFLRLPERPERQPLVLLD
jgi:hypothetical protein